MIVGGRGCGTAVKVAVKQGLGKHVNCRHTKTQRGTFKEVDIAIEISL
jgi:hypothetical protein